MATQPEKDRGRYRAEIEHLTHHIKGNPNDGEAYRNRGSAKIELGDFASAVSDFDQAIELAPNDAKAYYYRGTLKERSGDLTAAISDYDKAIKLDSKDTVAYYSRSAAVALQASAQERETIREHLKKEISAASDKLVKSIATNNKDLEDTRQEHLKSLRRFSRRQTIILLTWLGGLGIYFGGVAIFVTLVEKFKIDNPLALLPWVSIALVVSTPIIWWLRIINQNILEAKSLAEDMRRRQFIETQMAIWTGGTDASAKELLQEIRKKYFGSWQGNSPVEILLKLNGRRIGPSSLLDRIWPNRDEDE